jgi:8-oxo-dGTP diphosphatase
MPDEPAALLLARGPWHPDEVEVHWSDEHYDAPPARVEAADAAIAALHARGSPSHDGLSARLVAHEESNGKLTLHLQPTTAGSRVAAPRGCRRGRGAGRSAPAARSTSARAPSTR